MLTSESACGGSSTLLELRPKFLRFFDIKTLPDPTTLGFNVLAEEDWQGKFGSSLRRYYHHVSEKHIGEVVQLNPAGCQYHPNGDIALADHPMVPEVHHIQFFQRTELDEDTTKYASAFFKNKWWRSPEQRGAESSKNDFIGYMRWFRNSVWHPTEESGYWRSESRQITWHTLDSLVWELATSDMPRIHFGELYLYFTKSRMMAYQRLHSTPGKDSKKRREAKREAEEKIWQQQRRL